jgi:CubicO group peptidase (beta-lactamase class C family)
MTIRSFASLGNNLVALVLLVHASGALSQALPCGNCREASRQERSRVERFEKKIDDLRSHLAIPGMSAVIVKDQRVLWAKGFGFADLENRIPATPDTPYPIASLTKTFAATLIMQLVEQGKLHLDEPMSHYSSDFADDSVRIKHLLSHTSKGTPGDRYEYDGNRYDYLTPVIEKNYGKAFVELIVETFFDPLRMSSSVPVHDIVERSDRWAASLGQDRLSRYRATLSRLAQPYTLYGDDIVHTYYPPKDSIGAAAGLISTVLDLATYDAAIDRHAFLKSETQQKSWTAFVSNSGQRLPYGLGWFVTDYHGHKLIWHYGHWGTGFSAIYLKVPEKDLSLVMLANSEALADHQFQVGEDIVNNAFACGFLGLFALAKGETSQCERSSRTAVMKWIEQRRAKARTSIRLAPELLETYAGHYKYEPPLRRTLTVSREGNRLFVNIPEDFKAELFAESESKFFLKILPWWVTFDREEGQVRQLLVTTEDGQAVRAKRIQ